MQVCASPRVQPIPSFHLKNRALFGCATCRIIVWWRRCQNMKRAIQQAKQWSANDNRASRTSRPPPSNNPAATLLTAGSWRPGTRENNEQGRHTGSIACEQAALSSRDRWPRMMMSSGKAVRERTPVGVMENKIVGADISSTTRPQILTVTYENERSKSLCRFERTE